MVKVGNVPVSTEGELPGSRPYPGGGRQMRIGAYGRIAARELLDEMSRMHRHNFLCTLVTIDEDEDAATIMSTFRVECWANWPRAAERDHNDKIRVMVSALMRDMPLFGH